MRRMSSWAVIALLIAAVAGASAGPGLGQFKRGGRGGAAVTPLVAEKADPKVEKMIADLGSDDYRTREKAGHDLEAYGEKALPAMRATLLSTESPEVQRRLAVLVRKMDVARLVAPKRVTLSIKDKTIKEAIEAIAKHTNYKLEYSGNGGNDEPRHSFEFADTPFWVAVDQVAAAAGCIAFPDYEDDTIRIYNQQAINPYVAYAGPFRFVAQNINSNKSVQLSGINLQGGNNRQEYMNLSFQIQSEPKNPMLGVTQAEVISAKDENGASLAPPKDGNNRSYYYENRSMRGFNTYGNLSLNRNGGVSATTIKSLKAKVGIILLSGTAPEIVVPDPLKEKKKTFVGRTVEMDFGSFVADPNNKGQYTLDVTLRKHGETDPDRVDYNWSNSIWNKIELLDADGNRYSSYGPNNINNNGLSVQITVPYTTNDRRTGRPIKLGPPVKLVVNEWLSVTHEVTFEFKDIPLP